MAPPHEGLPLAFLLPLHLPRSPQPSSRTLSCRRRQATLATSSPPPSLVVGLTKYSHDASIAVVSATTGQLLFALSKERLTRRKHDGGDTGVLLRHALNYLRLPLSSVALVVANNHHHRIAPYEKRLPFAVAARAAPQSSLSQYNLVPGARRVELSHHLAHAWSAVRAFEGPEALVVVMDGMGDARDDWLRAGGEDGYFCEDGFVDDDDMFREVPAKAVLNDGRSGISYREAETVYRATRVDGRVRLTRLFKRWTEEVSPPELYNHGFENMESVGAVYSRVASHIFGDWNSCGKVMGLAPWFAESGAHLDDASSIPPLMTGRLFDGSFRVSADVLSALPHPNCWGESEARPGYLRLAARAQHDLEETVLDFLVDLRGAVGGGATDLIFCGGVALNSTLNGRIAREGGWSSFFVPPCPGDEGVAIGCAMFGFAHSDQLRGRQKVLDEEGKSMGRAEYLATQRYSPYLGTGFGARQILAEVRRFASWVQPVPNDAGGAFAPTVARMLADGKVVAWFSGRAEFGPRALGSRSLLADPRRADMVDRLNRVVKRREAFRPFAPTCLEPHVVSLFGNPCQSPYMTMTMPLENPGAMSAAAHVDGSARLQTLREEDNPSYYALISAFHLISGVPAVINTSFNVAGEPIVHSPRDAIRALLDSDGIDAVAFADAEVLVEARSTMPGLDDASTLFCSAVGNQFRSEVTKSSSGSVLRVSVTHSEVVPDESPRDADSVELSVNEDAMLDGMDLDRRVDLDAGSEELELLEVIAGESDGMSFNDLLEMMADDEVDEDEGEEDLVGRVAGFGPKNDEDVLESMIENLWRSRLISVKQSNTSRQ